ncbi:heme-binding protein [Planktotalea sp.]|uniref:heme-binding protein n=1 Tax=Planktotalea sp. TaxID=2029877 RepID=UPI003D6A4528
MTNPISPTTTPIIAEIPKNATTADATSGAYLPINKLLGTWQSPADTPTGYNVMPVPAGNKQMQSPTTSDDWLSKNFYYYEEMTFTAPGEAPNRGQLFQQGCYGMAYEQRVYFAPNTAGIGALIYQPPVAASAENGLVHYENGLWLHSQFEAQPEGAYGANLPYPPVDPSTGNPIATPTPPANPIVKQVSVPHGNSILALGGVTQIDGLPQHDVSAIAEKPFTLDATIPNPSAVLKAAVDGLAQQAGKTFKTTLLSVSTDAASGGSVTNIPFEVGNADVSGYEMDVWIIEVFDDPSDTAPSSTVLQYLQKIPMTFFITQTPTPGGKGNDGTAETFYHITANTLTKVPAV